MKYFGLYLQDLENAEHPIMQHLTGSQIQALELCGKLEAMLEAASHNRNLPQAMVCLTD